MYCVNVSVVSVCLFGLIHLTSVFTIGLVINLLLTQAAMSIFLFNLCHYLNGSKAT